MDSFEDIKKEIEKLIPESYADRDDYVEALVDQVKYPDLFNVPSVRPGFVLNSNPLLSAIEDKVGTGVDGNAFGIYTKINSWKTWLPELIQQGILEEKFSNVTADAAIYGRAGKVSASDYGAPNGPVLGGWESDENS